MIFPTVACELYDYLHSRPVFSRSNLAIVVTCHKSYINNIENVLESINSQNKNVFRVLVLDNCEYTAPYGWHVINGIYNCPNKARNAGLFVVAQAKIDWCVFWDSDNFMPNGYIDDIKSKLTSVNRNVGILSPDIVRASEDRIRFSVRQPTSRTFWSGREKSLSDTSSVWRVESILQAGGFTEGNTMLDDYSLALNITSLGWAVDKLEIPVLLRDHNKNRSLHLKRGELDLWNNRKFHIITLLAGRINLLQDWSMSIHKMDLPPNTHITMVNDSGCIRFKKELWNEVESISRLPSVRSIKILDAPKKLEPTDNWESIHRRVAMLYNLALSGHTADMVLFWEDDVIPSSDMALKYLFEGFLPFTKIAGVGGCYPARCNKEVAVASLEKERWGRMPNLNWLSKQKSRVSVGMLGGGFTLWAGHYLSESLPLRIEQKEYLGWDGSLGKSFNLANRSLWLDPRVFCEHRC